MNKGDYQCQFCTGDAWNRVVQQAGEFSRREAALWALNKKLVRNQEIAEQRIKLMTILLEEKEEDLNKKNVINLEDAVKARKATGGGVGGPGVDWLSPLNIHAIFLAKQKKDITSFVLTQYEVIFKGEKARGLKVRLNSFVDRPDECIAIDVDPKSFCEQNSHYETIRKGDEAE